MSSPPYPEPVESAVGQPPGLRRAPSPPGRRGPRFCAPLLLLLASCAATDTPPATYDVEHIYEDGPASVTLKVSRQQINVADTLELVLEARVPENEEVTFPALSGKLGEFTVIGSTDADPQLTGENQVQLTRSWKLEPFLAGEYEIPALTVGFNEERTIETEPVTIQVASVIPDAEEDAEMRDIAPPVELLDENLVEQGQAKLFYLRLSNILRHYIEDRFELQAPERTTEEFLADLRDAQAFDPRQTELLEEFLVHCDMVKFAEHQPTRDEVDGAVNACAQFVAETRPSEDTAVASGKMRETPSGS